MVVAPASRGVYTRRYPSRVGSWQAKYRVWGSINHPRKWYSTEYESLSRITWGISKYGALSRLVGLGVGGGTIRSWSSVISSFKLDGLQTGLQHNPPPIPASLKPPPLGYVYPLGRLKVFSPSLRRVPFLPLPRQPRTVPSCACGRVIDNRVISYDAVVHWLDFIRSESP